MGYLAQGLVEQELVNQPLKQLYAAVSHEFVDFMNEEYSFEVGKSKPYKIDQSEAYRKYQNLYPSKLGAKTFYSNMERYYKYHNIPYERVKLFDVRYFAIGGA